ncbi:hypothetical protein BDZ89DRAFT_1140067, partial [Hymenopellis radicata]
VPPLSILESDTLDRYGCHVECPAYLHNADAFQFQLANRVIPNTSIQICRGTPPDALTHYVRHDHPVNEDLLLYIPPISRIPFDFSRPIHVEDARAPNPPAYAILHVADPDLRVSEIRGALEHPGWEPARYAYRVYSKHTYPFDWKYFRSVVAHFTLERGVLIHKDSGKPVVTGYDLEDELNALESQGDPELPPVSLASSIDEMAGRLSVWSACANLRIHAWRSSVFAFLCDFEERPQLGDMAFPLSSLIDYQYVPMQAGHLPHARPPRPQLRPGTFLSGL